MRALSRVHLGRASADKQYITHGMTRHEFPARIRTHVKSERRRRLADHSPIVRARNPRGIRTHRNRERLCKPSTWLDCSIDGGVKLFTNVTRTEIAPQRRNTLSGFYHALDVSLPQRARPLFSPRIYRHSRAVARLKALSLPPSYIHRPCSLFLSLSRHTGL